MRNGKKIISIVLCFTVLLCIMSFIGKSETAEAAETYDLTVGDFQCNYNEDGTLTIMNYTGKAENLTIPATLADRKVTAIGEYAISYNSYVKNVVISSGITRIEKNGFRGSWYIEKLMIPESITFIGESAFQNMDELTSITIPSGITEISPYLFCSCDKLSSVQFNGNITSIGDGAFESSGIQSMSMPDSVTELGSYVFEYCKNLKNITLSKNLTVIPSYAFYNSGIESVVIPEGVREIKNNAFGNCEALVQIALPASLETIGYYAFRHTGLKRLDIGSNVSSIDGNDGRYYSGMFSFLESSDLYIEVSSENKNFSSRDGALYNKDQSILLAYPSASGTVAVPDKVMAIGGYSFAYTDVESVNLPDSVTKIGGSAFYLSALSSVELGNGLDAINSEAFAYCENLTSITIPALVTNIYSMAFSGSSRLQIEVMKENANFSSKDGVLYDKTQETLLAAPGVSGEYTVKNGVTVIGSNAFAHNNNITGIHTGDTVTEVGFSAFYDCKNLERLILGDSVTTLKDYMVYSCEKLYSIEGGKNAVNIYQNVTENGMLYTAFDIGSVSGKWKIAMIIGEEDSGIVQFAIANNLSYLIPGTRYWGDVDGKDGITVYDALLILLHLADKQPITDKVNMIFADCDGKGGITVADALYILEVLADKRGKKLYDGSVLTSGK